VPLLEDRGLIRVNPYPNVPKYSVHLAFARPLFQPRFRFRVQSNSIKAVSVYILNVAARKRPGGHHDQCRRIEHPSRRNSSTQLVLATMPTGRPILPPSRC